MDPLRHRVESWIGGGLVKTGLHRAVLRDRGLIVTFHRVDDASAGGGLTLSSREFEGFCRFFKDHFEVTTLDDMVTRVEQNRSISGRLAITFDDGYRDNYTVAAPILRKLGLPATFFVVTQYVGTDTVASWDRKLPRVPAWMTWDQVRELDREGFQIGAHTRTHADLGVVDGEQAEREIRGSREDLEHQLGHEVSLFAYPYGGRQHLTEANRSRVQAAGFRCCLSCHGGLARPTDDLFRLNRVAVIRWFRTPAQFAFEMVLRSG